MKRRLFTLTLLIAFAALGVSTTGSDAAYVRRTTVNPDRSVTIEWTLANTEVSNTSVAVDCCVVHTWYGPDRSTTFTTAPLSPDGTRSSSRYSRCTGRTRTTGRRTARSRPVRRTVGLHVETVDDGHRPRPVVIIARALRRPPCRRPSDRGSEGADQARQMLAGCGHAQERESIARGRSRPAAEAGHAPSGRSDYYAGREQGPVLGLAPRRRSSRQVELLGSCARGVVDRFRPATRGVGDIRLTGVAVHVDRENGAHPSPADLDESSLAAAALHGPASWSMPSASTSRISWCSNSGNHCRRSMRRPPAHEVVSTIPRRPSERTTTPGTRGWIRKVERDLRHEMELDVRLRTEPRLGPLVRSSQPAQTPPPRQAPTADRT